MFQHGSDQSDVEHSQLRRQRVDVSIEYFRLRIEQTVTEPVGVLPFVNRDVVIVKPALVIGVIKLIAERNERLLPRIGQIG